MVIDQALSSHFTHYSTFGEASSWVQAAAAPPPHGLTPEALQALREEGAQVLVYSGSCCMLFHGSKALEGNLAMPHSADTACSESAPIGAVVLGTAPPAECDDTDIFADVDPDYHMLIVQQGRRTMRFWRPIEDKVRTIKN